MGRSVYLNDNDRKVIANLAGNWAVWLDDDKRQFSDDWDESEWKDYNDDKDTALRIIKKMEG